MLYSRIYLIGFMGAGKSHIGALLAARLGYQFLDLDDYIMDLSGKKIADIFKEEGEGFFRALEQQALLQTLTLDKIVLATGGGCPCFENNLEIINTNGFSVFLDTSQPELIERLEKEKEKRPLIANLDGQELKTKVIELLLERRAFYEQAKLQLKAVEEEIILNAIMEAIGFK